MRQRRKVRPGQSLSRAAVALSIAVMVGALCAGPAAGAEPDAALSALADRVRARETAFAKSMADRDHAAFARFVSEEAIFLGRTVLRGRGAVAEGWKGYFTAKEAPFSWAPETVEVIDSGALALSRGPVFAPDGKRTGTFTSTWRLEKDGEWRVVLDSGCPPCKCP
jgi:ketosteroid isomerase-like protein